MDFVDLLREKAFLGREFLTWLWFKSEQGGGRVDLPNGETVEVYFLDKMTLDMSDVDTPQTVAIKGEHSELREGLAALREGKKIEEARIRLKAGTEDFTMALKGTWFSFASFRTPPILPSEEQGEDEGEEGRILEKISMVERGLEMVDGLFELFVRVRISDEWDTVEVPAIRKWAAAAR